MTVLNILRVLIPIVCIICNIQIYIEDSPYMKQLYERRLHGRSITAAVHPVTNLMNTRSISGTIKVRPKYQIIVRIILLGSRVLYWMGRTFYLFIKHGLGYYSSTSTYELIKSFVDVREPCKDLVKLIRHEGRIRGWRLSFLDNPINENDEIN